MTKRLYYNDTFLYEFDATVARVIEGEKAAIILDQSAFYPTSGGQVFDQGKLVSNGNEIRVRQVEEDESGEVIHYINPADLGKTARGAQVKGIIDAGRRRDHMQQHSGQHVLSAAFERLYQMPTVSFHMGEEFCTIDLAAKGIAGVQLVAAEKLANDVVFQNRPVSIKYVALEEAKQLGLRKLPEAGKEELRLIDIQGVDICACGGTHVLSTGQIGPILVRKSEKVKQGFRVEFVCGDRALKTARKDFEVLTRAAALFSTNIWEVPAQITKTLDDIKSAQKSQHKLLEELAEFWACELAVSAPSQDSFKRVKHVFADRDLAFVKMLAQKLGKQQGIVALLGTTLGQPAIVFSRSQDVDVDVSALMKEAMSAVGGRGGGTKDLAQGGVPEASRVPSLLDEVVAKLK